MAIRIYVFEKKELRPQQESPSAPRAAALGLQAGLRVHPQAGARTRPAFDSCREVQKASLFIF
ncbi:MAG: hypothetical protein P4M08_05900 [Oligoflexia bacterium]|nr:hypothetical protein [Oligoflexia bacterium]